MQLTTTRDGITLRALTPADADAYASLMKANAAHLTRLGNYVDEMKTSEADYAKRFADRRQPLEFGIYEADQLVGSISLVPVDPPRYGLGYWLAESACGRGLATAAVEAIAAYAERELAASDIFAGVTHGNDKSVAVLRRAGFTVATGFDDYTRFHRRLNADRSTNSG